MESESNTERVTVRTYVPAYQKEIWKDDADELGMSQSEFVRTMVQAGRRGFDLESGEGKSSAENSGGDDLTNTVLEVLSGEGCLSWEELLDSAFDSIEGRLDDALAELQETNRVRYSGRRGGYCLVEDE